MFNLKALSIMEVIVIGISIASHVSCIGSLQIFYSKGTKQPLILKLSLLVCIG